MNVALCCSTEPETAEGYLGVKLSDAALLLLGCEARNLITIKRYSA